MTQARTSEDIVCKWRQVLQDGLEPQRRLARVTGGYYIDYQ